MIFSVLIIVPCYLIASWGSQMINEIGNFPTKSEAIQAAVIWKVMFVVIVSLIALSLFFHIFN